MSIMCEKSFNGTQIFNRIKVHQFRHIIQFGLKTV
ncbi:MAG: hypothetical protein ACI8W0_001838 [Flavobacterium sp.]|jgi:hypothetical protein